MSLPSAPLWPASRPAPRPPRPAPLQSRRPPAASSAQSWSSHQEGRRPVHSNGCEETLFTPPGPVEKVDDPEPVAAARVQRAAQRVCGRRRARGHALLSCGGRVRGRSEQGVQRGGGSETAPLAKEGVGGEGSAHGRLDDLLRLPVHRGEQVAARRLRLEHAGPDPTLGTVSTSERATSRRLSSTPLASRSRTSAAAARPAASATEATSSSVGEAPRGRLREGSEKGPSVCATSWRQRERLPARRRPEERPGRPPPRSSRGSRRVRWPSHGGASAAGAAAAQRRR
jgi:hypothetical protein